MIVCLELIEVRKYWKVFAPWTPDQVWSDRKKDCDTYQSPALTSK